jgi:Tfp pilus assembly protein PilO
MKNRFWVIAAATLIVFIVLAGWIFGIGPQLSLVSSTNNKRISVEATNTATQARIIRLRSDYLSIETLKSNLANLKMSVPASASIPSFVTELNTIANTNGVTVKSLSVSDARQYAPAPATPAGSSGKAPTPATTNALISSSNFVLVPVQFAISGDYAKVLNFVHDVQNGSRLFLVSTFSSAGATNTKAASLKDKGTQQVDSSVTGFAYVILGPQ